MPTDQTSRPISLRFDSQLWYRFEEHQPQTPVKSPRLHRPPLSEAKGSKVTLRRYILPHRTVFCSLPNLSPKAIPTKSPTRFPTAILDACLREDPDQPRRLRNPDLHRPRRHRRRNHHQSLRRFPEPWSAASSNPSATTTPSTASTPIPAPSSPASTSSPATSPWASTPAAPAIRE